jgi:hypothetical protein
MDKYLKYKKKYLELQYAGLGIKKIKYHTEQVKSSNAYFSSKVTPGLPEEIITKLNNDIKALDALIAIYEEFIPLVEKTENYPEEITNTINAKITEYPTISGRLTYLITLVESNDKNTAIEMYEKEKAGLIRDVKVYKSQRVRQLQQK